MATSNKLAQSLRYLADLSMNNNREWFEANKSRYEREVREPALEFISAVGERLGEVSTMLVADERKAGGSLMRVYRDTRFSKDKTPYKTNVGIRFAHVDKGDVHAPGLYVHLATDGCFLGAGAWHPEPEPLAAIRRAIVESPDDWRAATQSGEFTRSWALGGESLKRVPKGFDASHPLAADLRRIDFIAVADLPTSWLESDEIVDRAMERFVDARGLMRFLTEAVGAKF